LRIRLNVMTNRRHIQKKRLQKKTHSAKKPRILRRPLAPRNGNRFLIAIAERNNLAEKLRLVCEVENPYGSFLHTRPAACGSADCARLVPPAAPAVSFDVIDEYGSFLK